MRVRIVGVLGLGIFGEKVARDLSKYGTEVIAVDTNQDKVQLLSDVVTNAVVGDFTDFELLRNIGIANCDIVIIGTGTNLESAVLAVMHCKKLKVPQIIAKARGTTFEEVLYEIGATTVITPEKESAKRLVSQLLTYHIEEILHLDESTSIIEFSVPQKWIGKKVTELDLRRDYDLNLIGERDHRGSKMTPVILDKPFEEGNILVGITYSDIFEKYDYLGQLD